MKFAVVVAGLCGVAAAGSWERRTEPSYTPVPSNKPITCYRANERFQICDKACQVVKEDTDKCCSWGQTCDPKYEYCTVDNCCEYDDDKDDDSEHHPPSEPDHPDEPKPEPTPTPKPMTICGGAQHEILLDEPLFNCTAHGRVVNFHEKCCHEEIDGECGDQPLCSDIEVCCIVDTDLYEKVLNCTTMLADHKEATDETLFDCDFRDDYMPYEFEVREDGFLCCKTPAQKTNEDGKVIEIYNEKCVAAGAVTQCTSDSCCVPQDRFCSEEYSPECVDADREIVEDETCYTFYTPDVPVDNCDETSYCCPI